MIDDPEIRDLFASESEECVSAAEYHLLRMESGEAEPTEVNDLFRAIHTLKGASGMLGVGPVEVLAHALESVLSEVRAGTLSLGTGRIQALLEVLDHLKRLIQAALTGAAAPQSLNLGLAAVERVHGIEPEPKAPAPAQEGRSHDDSRRAEPTPTQEVGARIEAARLDEILSLTRALISLSSRLAVRVTGDLDHQEDLARLKSVTENLSDSVQRLRLQTVDSLLKHFPRQVRDTAVALGKEVHFVTSGSSTRVDRSILEELRAPLTHLLRNALDHGLETPAERVAAGKPATGKIEMRARREGGSLVIEVEDDGRGLDVDRILAIAAVRGLRSPQDLASMSREGLANLIFTPGFSTSEKVTEVSGRGVGLDAVRAQVDRLKGTVEVLSEPGQGCLFRLRTTLTVAATRVVLVRAGTRWVGVPLEEIESAQILEMDDVLSFPGGRALAHAGTVVPLLSLADLLNLSVASVEGPRPCLILNGGSSERVALLVEQVKDEHDLIVQPFEAPLHRVRYWRGASLLPGGEVCLILRSLDVARATVAPSSAGPVRRSLRVLLAEDSLSTRAQEKRILEAAGYEVVTAVDGLDALNKLAVEAVDVIVSDVDMPNMDGLTLCRRVRSDPRLASLPLILVTTLSGEEDRRKGLEAGANAYIPKPTFSQNVLLATLARCV